MLWLDMTGNVMVFMLNCICSLSLNLMSRIIRNNVFNRGPDENTVSKYLLCFFMFNNRDILKKHSRDL